MFLRFSVKEYIIYYAYSIHVFFFFSFVSTVKSWLYWPFNRYFQCFRLISYTQTRREFPLYYNNVIVTITAIIVRSNNTTKQKQHLKVYKVHEQSTMWVLLISLRFFFHIYIVRSFQLFLISFPYYYNKTVYNFRSGEQILFTFITMCAQGHTSK